MHKQEIETLFQYNAWSNARILDAAAMLAPEQFLAPAPFPHGSLRATLVHALFGECLWRNRWEGTPAPQASRLDPEEFPAVRSLRARWSDEEAKLMDYVASVTDQELSRKFCYVSTEGYRHERAVWESMLHLINHGTQHKSEAAAILTSMEKSPGDIDLIVFLNGGV